MKTEAVRLYDVKTMKLETFELPEIKKDENSCEGCQQQYMHVNLQGGYSGQQAIKGFLKTLQQILQ